MSLKQLRRARPAKHRRAGVVAACAVLALVPMTPSATAATRGPAAPPPTGPVAATPAGFASWADLFAVQDQLNAAARHIVAARDSGYAGVVAAPANRDLRVYWKGDVPRSVRRIADGLGVPVVFLPARFSEREMLAEARRLTTDPRVLSVGPEADGSGLTIAVTEAGSRELRVGATGVLGTTTMVLHLQSGPAPQLLSRQDDYSPRLGGSKYRIGSGSCTTGFSITWNGEARMLTAGHCGNNTNVAYDGGGDLIGDVFNDVPGRDTMMMNTRVEGETFGPSIYIGPWDGNVARNVASAEEDFVGNYVCTGGARTGEHCGIRVTHVNQTDEGFFPLTRGELDGAGCAAARGDSGGPVYNPGAARWTCSGAARSAQAGPGPAQAARTPRRRTAPASCTGLRCYGHPVTPLSARCSSTAPRSSSCSYNPFITGGADRDPGDEADQPNIDTSPGSGRAQCPIAVCAAGGVRSAQCRFDCGAQVGRAAVGQVSVGHRER